MNTYRKVRVSLLNKSRFFIFAVMLMFVAMPAMGETEFDHLLGVYTGQWTNQTFMQSGDAMFDFQLDEDLGLMTVIVDMDGGVFGGFDPPPIEITGTAAGNIAQFFIVGNPTYGNISGSLTSFNDMSLANLSATITNVPGEFITEVTAQGTISNGVLDMTYDVSFVQGPGAVGVVHAEIPEPGSVVLLGLGGLMLMRRW